MTKIDFYVLADEGQQAREELACRLIDKIYQLQHRVYVHTESQRDAQRLDDLLWTFRPGSFIPHYIEQSGEQLHAPIVIGFQDTAPQISDVLLNLSQQVPLFFSQFDRVAELVGSDEQSRTHARNRFRFYKDRGYELTTHEMANS
jgi:DNA polymerase-3 subunit chi